MSDTPPPPPGDDPPTVPPVAKPAQVDNDRTEIAPMVLRPKPPAAEAVSDDVPPYTSAPPTPATQEPPRLAAGAPVPVGTLINNNYEIKELINAGGMGEVFRGENVFTGDAVAIKIVLQSLAHDPKVAALFMREAKVLCQLSDQAIVRYYNFVRDPALDRFCLIMEFIDGTPLSDHVRQVAPLTLPEATRLLKRLALGLERAHGMEVIHRDLSPDNVMLKEGKVDKAVLIDFGIAKSQEMTENSLFGQMAGKYKYVSPEQLGHFGGEIGPRTDIYGLALLMAAAIRGEPIDMGSSVVEAVDMRRSIPPLDGVYDELRPLFAHMLEPNPANRPARMSDVIRLLEHPHEVPPQYGSVPGVPPEEFERTVFSPTTSFPMTSPPRSVQGIAVPGLRQPPTRRGGPFTQNPGLSIAPGLAITDEHSASPFGAASVQPAPLPREEPPAKRGGGGMLWVAGILLLAALGGGFAWNKGLIGGSRGTATVAAADPGRDILPTTPPAAVEPAAAKPTRDGFLATFSLNPCAYANRIDAGPQTGMIETFGTKPGPFIGLPDAYAKEFGAKPDLVERTVTDAQCPVIDLTRTLQAGTAVAPVLTLDSAQMTPGGSIVGQLRERRGRAVWLVLITPDGAVYSLTPRLTDQPDGSSTFSFGLNTKPGAGPVSHLILAIASDEPLLNAAAAKDGVKAATLMPLVLAEVKGRNGKASGALRYFEMSP